MYKYVYNLQQIVKIKGAKLKSLYLFFSEKFNKISLSLIFIIKKIVNPNFIQTIKNNYIMKKFIVLLYIIIFFSCKIIVKQKLELKGTKWECKIADSCINSYEFITSKNFRFISCEMQDEYYGEYYFVNSFLMIDEKVNIFNKDSLNNTIENTERKLYKVKIKGNKLKHLSMKYWLNGKWVNSNFKFKEIYVYQKK